MHTHTHTHTHTHIFYYVPLLVGLIPIDQELAGTVPLKEQMSLHDTNP